MMTKEMDDGELWLPSDFLTDDFFLDKSNAVDSPPAETESENEDEYIAGLTQKMAHAFLNEEEDKGWSPPARQNPKPSVMATSPQSTLCGIGSWSFSSNGSPDGPSQVSSPPSTPFQQPRDDALDLLYAAAGQVVRLGLQDENAQAPGLFRVPQNPPTQIQAPPTNQRLGVFSSQDLIQQQLQAARFYQLKRQQVLKQQYSAAWGRQQQQCRERVLVRPLGLSNSAWPPLQKQQQHQQQQHGSGMTAVFLNGGRRQSNGTGVFLPRRVGTPSEPKKKPACSTVLLPARVVQALNLNLDEVGVHPRMPGCYVLENDVAMGRSNAAMSYSKRSQPAPAASASHEIQLPQEWTY